MLPNVETLATVVVCEDDEDTREQLCRNLCDDRFATLAASTAEEALHICRYEAPDAMLLDLGLPDASGLDVLREIRGSDNAAPPFDPMLPVIVISGRGAEEERLRGLSVGADDYLTKPFSYRELQLRLRNLLTGRKRIRNGPLRVGDLRIDFAGRVVEVAGRPVTLANKEFELLRALAREPQRVFTKGELLHEVWGYQSLARTRTLDSHASRLRRKLDPDGRFIVNCWGVGYRLVEGPR